MLMLTAYIDETGHYRDEKQKFVGMAGLIAPAENWKEFKGKWKAALDLPYINLPYFHMTDFAARKKVYKDWSDEKRTKVYDKLLRVIEITHPLPLGAIISLEFYRKIEKEYQDYFRDPYVLCFQALLAVCTQFL